MGEFDSNDHYVYYCGHEALRINGVGPRDLPHPGIKPESPALISELFTTSAFWEVQEAV